MITKVVHGWRVGGLITYLFGPGRANEHVNPRVVATWDGLETDWRVLTTGETAPAPGPLIEALRRPALDAGLPERGPEGKRGYVWHCSARLAAGDRVLSDEQWAGIARELLDGAGVVARDDPTGPRWAAIRHADDHIHIAVVLVRQDTGRRVWPKRDYPRLRATAQRIEQRLGLTATAGPDGTASRAPVRGEIEKAQRTGREPARVELERVVRTVAVASSGPDGFVAGLVEAGVEVELRRAPSGDLLGYKVARAGDLDAGGRPVFFSGSKLAPDLSLPRLMHGWGQAGEGTLTGDPLAAATRRLGAARAGVTAARRGQLGEDPDDLAAATLDVLVAVRGWDPTFGHAADRFARSARAPRGVRPQPGATGAGLRRVARQLVRASRPRLGHDPHTAGVALVVALTVLILEVAAWQRETQRTQQAAAAQDAADTLGQWVYRHGGSSSQVAAPLRQRGRMAAPRRPRRDHASDHTRTTTPTINPGPSR